MTKSIWLTAAETGRKYHLHFSRINHDSVNEHGQLVEAVTAAMCHPVDYGFYRYPITQESKRIGFWWMPRTEPLDMIQVRLKGVEQPEFFLCSLAQFNDARKQGIPDLHTNEVSIAKQLALLDRLAAISPVIHVPKFHGTDRALPFDHPAFTTFPTTPAAIAGILGRAPLGELYKPPRQPPKLLLPPHRPRAAAALHH